MLCDLVNDGVFVDTVILVNPPDPTENTVYLGDVVVFSPDEQQGNRWSEFVVGNFSIRPFNESQPIEILGTEIARELGVL